ncbi:MAG: tRNA (N(6)-L-threonylcarbamoyladenosine(37)-C(2))-methylthiotransferase MtaB [Bacteroidales bacterium]|jgi:threonylcarbamoyladenosine tRNA methylthiotransferase MtaB
MKKVAFHTLGCKLNFAESSDLARTFTQNGYEQVSSKEFADVYIVNTCTVTQVAEKKCRNAIRQANHINSDAIIAVIGCFAQLEPQEIAKIEGVDIILGNADKHKLFEYISNKEVFAEHWNNVEDIANVKEFVPSYSSNDRTRSFLKIQDGCDYFCTYCAIPYARGRSRSETIENTILKAKELEKEGKKEVVLTGVNIGDFGKHNNETFFDLIKELDKIEHIERYRISSIEPNLITNDIIDFVKQSRSFLPHFHIPLQAGTNLLLERMKRKYNRELFAQRINYINQVMPNAFIAADIIVGFPGETDEEFNSTIEFINSLPLAALHVFTYSERPNSLAINFDGKVPINIRKKRSLVLQDISNNKKKEFYKTNIDYNAKVLWESDNEKGMMFGFSDNYIRVARKFEEKYINAITEETIQTLSTNKDYFLI